MRTLAALLLFLLCNCGAAAQTRILDWSQRGGQRGTEVMVRIRGQSLDTLLPPLVDPPDIHGRVVEVAKNGRSATLLLAIDKNAQLGPHLLWPRTVHGLFNPIGFSVSAHQEVDEAEAWRRCQAAPVTINGSMGSEGSHTFRVMLKREPTTIEVEAFRLGPLETDLRVEVIDETGQRVAASDDSVPGQLDPILTFTPRSAGTFTIRIWESTMRVGNNRRYRLHVVPGHRPIFSMPLGGQADKPTKLKVFAGEKVLAQTVTIPASAPGTHLQMLELEQVAAIRPIRLAMARTPVTVESEVSKNLLQVPGTHDGILSSPGEIDEWTIETKKPLSLSLRLLARPLLSPLDGVLDIHDSNGKRLGSVDDVRGNPDPSLRIRLPKKGFYTVRVRDQLLRGGPEFFYRLEANAPRPPLTARIDPGSLRLPSVCTVPQGGLGAVRLVIPRGAKPPFRITNLPKGVTFRSLQVDEGNSRAVAIFEASPDAKLEASVARLEWGDPKTCAGINQLVPLVLTNNNRMYWGEALRGIPVTVTKKPPFRIVVNPPEVPIIRNSSYALSVRVERDKGFQGTVTLRLKSASPGIRYSTVQCRGKATKATLRLGQSGTPPKQPWHLVVEAKAYIKGHTYSCSSEAVPLRVESMYSVPRAPTLELTAGNAASWPISLTPKREWAGDATLEIKGLPDGVAVTCPPIRCDQKSVTISVASKKSSTPGTTTRMRFRLKVPTESGVAIQEYRGGTIRILEPLPSDPHGGAEDSKLSRGTVENPKT